MKSLGFALSLFLTLLVLQPAWAQLEEEEESSSSQVYSRTLPGGVSISGMRLEEPVSYKGTLPCADCPGINTWLNLFPGGWYALSMDYLERSAEPYHELGRWQSSANGATLQLYDGQSTSQWRVLSNGRLRLLDRDGEDIDSSLGYDLKREMAFDWFTPRVELQGMFRYYADAATFTDCVSGQGWPVAMVGGYQSLERVYSQSGANRNQGLLVQIEARLSLLPQVDGDAFVPTIVPLRFIDSWPGEDCDDHWQGGGGDDDDRGGIYDGDYPLVGTRWGLVRLGNDALPQASDDQPYLELEDNGSFGGNGGCNSYSGSYQLRNRDIGFGAIRSTKMFCEGRSEIEAEFFEALQAADSWKKTGAVLDFYDSDGDLLARFAASSDQGE